MPFDFSQFHPLDHWPWEQRCRSLPGGWRRHLAIEWAFRLRPSVGYSLWRPVQWIRCPMGHHRIQQSWSAKNGYRVVCIHCGYSRAARPEEEFPHP